MMGRWTSWGTGLLALFLLLVLQTLGFAEERYTVKTGDSLYKIAKAYGVSIVALKAANPLETENLRPRQVLVIPASREKRTGEAVQPPVSEVAKKPSVESVSYLVKKGDNLHSISKKAGIPVEEIKRINQLQADRLTIGQTLLLSHSGSRTDDPEEESGDIEENQGLNLESAQGEAEETPDPVSGSWKSPEERSLFVRVVKNFLGVPYRLGGSTLKGIDCSAFVKKIYEIFNIQIPRTTWEQFRIGKRVGKSELEEGDLVFFKVPTRRASNRHVGIYIGNDEFVHASSRTREVRVDSLNTPYFSKRFMNGVRLKELERDL